MASNALIPIRLAHQSSATSTVRIRVGTPTTWSEYVVRKDYLRTSAVIKAELEKSTGLGPPVVSICWSGDNVFPLYLHWLRYRKVLPFSELNQKPKVIPQSDYIDLMKCYCFGSHIRDEVYQDMVISTIIERLITSDHLDRRQFVTSFGPRFVSGLYQRTPADSLLRKLVVFVLPRLLTEEDYAHIGKQTSYPNEFLAAMCPSTGQAFLKKNSANVRPTLPPTGAAASEALGNTLSGPVSNQKQVAFKKDSQEETECTYHLHSRSGGPCWRAMPEFRP